MVKAIRKTSLKIIVTLLKIFMRPSKQGWQRSTRSVDLDGR